MAFHFDSCSYQDVLRIVLNDGTTIQGSFLPQAGMNFIHVRDGSPTGKIEGPIDVDDVAGIERLATRAEVVAERKASLRGSPFPGPLPRTRDDYEYRLRLLARAIASEESTRRRDELRYQFNDVAAEIGLAKPKRAWMLAEGQFSLSSNETPTMRDLWFADVASPSHLRRPRAQDFDPDPAERRRRVPLPEDVVAETRSIPNMLVALRAAGVRAVIALAGDPLYERADIQVDLAAGRLHRFIAEGRRQAGVTAWRLRWAGNESKAGARRYRSIIRTEEYKTLLTLIGLRDR
jgi:hypothetical protein